MSGVLQRGLGVNAAWLMSGVEHRGTTVATSPTQPVGQTFETSVSVLSLAHFGVFAVAGSSRWFNCLASALCLVLSSFGAVQSPAVSF